MLKPIQEQLYGNIYVFSDNDENLDDLDKRYKYLGNNLKAYLKQKKRQGSIKTSSEQVEATS